MNCRGLLAVRSEGAFRKAKEREPVVEPTGFRLREGKQLWPFQRRRENFRSHFQSAHGVAVTVAVTRQSVNRSKKKSKIYLREEEEKFSC